MEVIIDKRYPLDVSVEPAWDVLSDIQLTAGCMPGAAITETLGPNRYKGTVKSKVGPATMVFNGEIEVLAVDEAAHRVEMQGKGADKSGSSAAMHLVAHVETDATSGLAVLVGKATVTVNGKLAQFGNRLIQPVADALLAQFADNFRTTAHAMAAEAQAEVLAAQVVEAPPTPEPEAVITRVAGEPMQVREARRPTAPAPQGRAALTEPRRPVPMGSQQALNPLALLWAVIKSWFTGLFGKRA